MDNKQWDVAISPKGQRYKKAVKVRGVLRTRSEGIKKGFTKPKNNKAHRVNPGATVSLCCMIINCKIKASTQKHRHVNILWKSILRHRNPASVKSVADPPPPISTHLFSVCGLFDGQPGRLDTWLWFWYRHPAAFLNDVRVRATGSRFVDLCLEQYMVGPSWPGQPTFADRRPVASPSWCWLRRAC